MWDGAEHLVGEKDPRRVSWFNADLRTVLAPCGHPVAGRTAHECDRLQSAEVVEEKGAALPDGTYFTYGISADGREVEVTPAPEEPKPPTIGRIVLYRLRQEDVDYLLGSAQQAGDEYGDLHAGLMFPAVVVRVTPPTDKHPRLVNLRLLVDGTATPWLRDVGQGGIPGTWCWHWQAEQ